MLIKIFYRYFTKEPHLAGTPIGKQQAEYVKKEWDKHGFDKVEIKSYEVLLSYPRSPARLTVLDQNQNLIYTANTVEEPFLEEERSNLSVYPFNAYSASGDVEVYISWIFSQKIILLTFPNSFQLSISYQYLFA